jgi:hypothetical protein
MPIAFFEKNGTYKPNRGDGESVLKIFKIPEAGCPVPAYQVRMPNGATLKECLDVMTTGDAPE